MTSIAAVSSVPPHIQPPIAQVPSAMRESLKGVARYSISALSRLGSEVMIFLVSCMPRSPFGPSRRGRTPVYRTRNADRHDLCLTTSNMAHVPISVGLTPSAATTLFPLSSRRHHVGLLQPNIGLKSSNQG